MKRITAMLRFQPKCNIYWIKMKIMVYAVMHAHFLHFFTDSVLHILGCEFAAVIVGGILSYAIPLPVCVVHFSIIFDNWSWNSLVVYILNLYYT